MSCNGQRFVTGGNINSDRQTDKVQSYNSTLGTLGDNKIKFKSLKKNQYLLTHKCLCFISLWPKFLYRLWTLTVKTPNTTQTIILQCYMWNLPLYNNFVINKIHYYSLKTQSISNLVKNFSNNKQWWMIENTSHYLSWTHELFIIITTDLSELHLIITTNILDLYLMIQQGLVFYNHQI